MNDSNLTAFKEPAGDTLRGMRLVLYPLTFLVGLAGNIIVCILIFTWRKSKNFNPSRLFILNLSISDLLVVTLFIPFDLAYLENDMVWRYGLFMCKFVNTLSFLSVIVSGTTLAAISIDRYRAVVYPLKPPFTYRTVSIIISFIWLYAVLTLLPFIESLTIYPEGSCENDYNWWPSFMWVQVTFVLCAFVPGCVIPLGCISVFYALIARHLKKERRSHDLLLRSDVAKMRVQQNAKMVKILICLTLTYIMCILPHYIIMLMFAFSSGATRILPYINEVFEFSRLLVTVNSCLNPVLYSVVSREFRAELRSLCKAKKGIRARSMFGSTKNSMISSRISKVETQC